MENENTSEAAGPMDRRTFVKVASAAGLSLAAGCMHKPGAGKGGATSQPTSKPTTTQAARVWPAPVGPPKKFVIVGTGVRHQMYRNAIQKEYKDYAQLVGICDANPGRMELAVQVAGEGANPPPAYMPADFEKMLTETKPDAVIVTTMCSTHSEYIVRAMNAGFNVITEKPLTTTAEKCQQIIDTRKKTGKNVG